MPCLARYLAAVGGLTIKTLDTVIGAIQRDWIADRITSAEMVKLTEAARTMREEVEHVAAAVESPPAS